MGTSPSSDYARAGRGLSAPPRVNNASILLVTVIGHEPSGYAMQSSYQVNLTR